jgi:hypothetical protein
LKFNITFLKGMEVTETTEAMEVDMVVDMVVVMVVVMAVVMEVMEAVMEDMETVVMGDMGALIVVRIIDNMLLT